MYLLQILLMSDYVGFTHLCLVARPTFCIAVIIQYVSLFHVLH